MNTPTTPVHTDCRSGGILVIVLVLTALTTVAIGSIMFTLSSDVRTAQRAFARDRAFYLAEAGIALALAKLNAGLDADVTFAQSHAYLHHGDELDAQASEWGFQTAQSSSNGVYTIMAIGRFEDQTTAVSGEIQLTNGLRRIHALYNLALYAGNSSGDTNYVMAIGGTGTGADFIKGDIYSGGRLTRSGDALLRLPEILQDIDGDKIHAEDEAFEEAYALQNFTNGPISSAALTTYSNSMASVMRKVYNNGTWDPGEPFVDTIGNGIYEPNTLDTYTDANGNGRYNPGDSYVDKNNNGRYDSGEKVIDFGDGIWNAGEDWVEDTATNYYGQVSSGNTQPKINLRVNNRYDIAGGYKLNNSNTRRTSYYIGTTQKSCASWPAESFTDVGDGVYNPAPEVYVDRDGIYQVGEKFLDDRNGVYDYGTQATGAITGMPDPATGQRAATGNDPVIDPPDLDQMYYAQPKTGTVPSEALPRWGHDILVNSDAYGGSSGNNTITITDANNPSHIFIQNPPIGSSGSTNSNNKTVYHRDYSKTTNSTGVVMNDYFLEDPTDASWNTTVSSLAIDGISDTAPTLITVKPEHNNKTYFIDGNLYLHSPLLKAFRFRNPGTIVTFVASGNITLSDEFYYNATYSTSINTVDNINSGIVNNPRDALCLIAIKRNGVANSGNIYLGDAQFGTGGSIHAMLYAENDFVDNNLSTADQPFLSIYGTMSAGNQIRLSRSGGNRTRLDVTLDKRIAQGTIFSPGAPPPVGSQRSIILDSAWFIKPGSWRSQSKLQ